MIKANVVGAAAGLVTVCWYALVDPSWENMGLIADASKLPPDGAGAERRDAMTAIRTSSRLLNGAKRVREINVGDGAHAYVFEDAAGYDVIVAWADDAKGAAANTTVRLPLFPRFERLEWDYGSTGRTDILRAKNSDLIELIKLTTMPVFFRDIGVY